MKILLAHAHSHPFTMTVTKTLHEHLRRTRESIDVINVAQATPTVLARYDSVVMVSDMWPSQLNGAATQFLAANQQELLLKRCFLPIVSPFTDEVFQQHFVKHVSPELLQHAYSFNLGMGDPMQGLTFFQKLRWRFTGVQVQKQYDRNAIETLAKMVLTVS